MAITCLELNDSELAELLADGYAVAGGPYATEELCLAACDASGSTDFPGYDCASALTSTDIDITYEFDLGTEEGAWFRYGPIANGTVYHVSGTNPDSINITEPYIYIYEGTDCNDQAFLGNGGTACQQHTKVGTDYIWVQFFAWEAAAGYTLTVATGACP